MIALYFWACTTTAPLECLEQRLPQTYASIDACDKKGRDDLAQYFRDADGMIAGVGPITCTTAP